MYRLLLAVLTVATLATSCTSATTSGSAAEMTSVTTPSDHGDTSNKCPPQGCPVPNCGHDDVIHVMPHLDPSGVGTQDVDTDLAAWIETLVGQGEGRGIPTPENKIAFLVTRDGTDLALLQYVSDGKGGWLRDGYTACASALLP